MKPKAVTHTTCTRVDFSWNLVGVIRAVTGSRTAPSSAANSSYHRRTRTTPCKPASTRCRPSNTLSRSVRVPPARAPRRRRRRRRCKREALNRVRPLRTGTRCTRRARRRVQVSSRPGTKTQCESTPSLVFPPTFPFHEPRVHAVFIFPLLLRCGPCSFGSFFLAAAPDTGLPSLPIPHV